MANQQTSQMWMTKPLGFTGCPPGLEYLCQIDQLLVQQQVEMVEVLLNWEGANKYKIKNNLGQQVYFAAEESDVCSRQCCGAKRGFEMHITDNFGNEIIRVKREFKFCSSNGFHCCAGLDCCSHEILVESPPGSVIGSVRQQPACVEPRYSVLDASGDEVLLIIGPICICQGPCCTHDQEFKVMSRDESQQVGKISKQWSGLIREIFSDSDNFGISFPIDLDVRVKGTLLGAVFLIDFMFFEEDHRSD